MAQDRFNKGEVVEAVIGQYRTRYWIAYKAGLDHVYEGGESAFDAEGWRTGMVGVSTCHQIALDLGIEIDTEAERKKAMRTAGDQFAYQHMSVRSEEREKVREVLDRYGLYDVRVVLAEYEPPAKAGANGKG